MEVVEAAYNKKSPFGNQTATAYDLYKLGRNTET